MLPHGFIYEFTKPNSVFLIDTNKALLSYAQLIQETVAISSIFPQADLSPGVIASLTVAVTQLEISLAFNLQCQI